ncbi:MAG: rod shape-determining protein MreC, partial [bacterium]
MSTVTDRSTPRRRILLALVAVTALVLAVDLSGATDLEPVRRAAATVLGPLERLVGPGEGEVSALR